MNTPIRYSIRLALLLAAAAGVASLSGCSPTIKIDVLGGQETLRPMAVFADPKPGTDKVAMIDLRGTIVDAQRPALVGAGVNPVDRFVTQLEMAAKDETVKAVIVRITSPGGTVTASDILYDEITRFRETTGKPIIASLGEVAASGGYYVALSTDEIIAQPTSITGSVGVIIPTMNVSDGLARIGIRSRSVKSGANKDLANPLEPMREAQYAVLQGMVDDFYARFRGLVVERRPNLSAANLDTATDGRIFTGTQAAELGMVDSVGSIRDAFASAKRRAGIEAATLIRYADEDRPARTAYAATPSAATAGGTQINLMQLNMGAGTLAPVGETSGVYYLWMPPTP